MSLVVYRIAGYYIPHLRADGTVDTVATVATVKNNISGSRWRGRRWQLDGTLDQHSFQVTHISLYLQTLEGLVTVVTPSTKAHLKNSLSADSWKSFILGLLIQQFQTIAAAHSVTAKHHGRASRSKS